MAARSAGRAARLFVLGTLASEGPNHGHQIRRLAERIDVENGSETGVGSIYHALRRLEEEGLVEPVRAEQSGRRPPRTIFAITADGREELASLRDQLLYEITPSPDPFDVALWVSAGAPLPELQAVLDNRWRALRELGRELAEERVRLTEAAALPPAGQTLFRHRELRIEAELRWHEELAQRLPEIAARRTRRRARRR